MNSFVQAKVFPTRRKVGVAPVPVHVLMFLLFLRQADLEPPSSPGCLKTVEFLQPGIAKCWADGPAPPMPRSLPCFSDSSRGAALHSLGSYRLHTTYPHSVWSHLDRLEHQRAGSLSGVLSSGYGVC